MNRRTSIAVPCEYCGQLFDRQPNKLARKRGRFCSPRCATFSRTRALGYRVSGGRQRRPTKLYNMWRSMRVRCSAKCKDAKTRRLYFQRGVRVCEVWVKFASFRAWACTQLRGMPANVKRRELSIDRKDSDAHYEPENCSLIPRRENSAKAGRRTAELRARAAR